jgi:hypothetical protein
MILRQRDEQFVAERAFWLRQASPKNPGPVPHFMKRILFGGPANPARTNTQ